MAPDPSAHAVYLEAGKRLLGRVQRWSTALALAKEIGVHAAAAAFSKRDRWSWGSSPARCVRYF